MKPKLSVIIPVYNGGEHLLEAIKSIEDNSSKNSVEIIIANDGSTDSHTLNVLSGLSLAGYTVVHQENQGPGAARNTAIRASNGEYLLFLDDDNRIRPNFIDKGLAALTADESIGVVYGNAFFFGVEDYPVFKSDEFDMKKILFRNYIDMCSIIRRKLWDEIGPFDENRVVMGHEDWDYWVRVGKSSWKFHFINEDLFDYRVRHNSLLRQSLAPENEGNMYRYFYQKHFDSLIENYRHLYQESLYYKEDKQRPLRSFFKFFVNKYLRKRV